MPQLPAAQLWATAHHPQLLPAVHPAVHAEGSRTLRSTLGGILQGAEHLLGQHTTNTPQSSVSSELRSDLSDVWADSKQTACGELNPCHDLSAAAELQLVRATLTDRTHSQSASHVQSHTSDSMCRVEFLPLPSSCCRTAAGTCRTHNTHSQSASHGHSHAQPVTVTLIGQGSTTLACPSTLPADHHQPIALLPYFLISAGNNICCYR
jgi:hypothetical protein